MMADGDQSYCFTPSLINTLSDGEEACAENADEIMVTTTTAGNAEDARHENAGKQILLSVVSLSAERISLYCSD